MRKFSFILVPLLIAILAACGNDNEKKNSVHHNSQMNTYDIELVNNEKWKVHGEMLVHIRNIEKDITEFTNDAETNYDELSKKLNKHIQLLTSNCTMTGQAHDELHKWLVPFIDLIDQLEDATDKARKEEAIIELKEAMKEFNTYFE